jgi:peptidylprolyl isomerase
VTLVAIMVSLVATITPAASASDPLAKIAIAGAIGEEATLEFAKPFATKKSLHREVVAGTGEKLTKGSKVTFDYVIVDGRTGKQLDSSFGAQPGSLVLDKSQAPAALVNGLVGASVGGRVLVAVGPKEGLAARLNTKGVKKSDTLLFVVDTKSVRTPLARATGDPVAPAAGLPTVALGADGKPTITVPKKTAPTQLVVQTLIKGTGPVVTSGQTITVHYTGVIWESGKQFDSSWKRGSPTDFTIGTGQVIPGWDEGLVGQTVGSQVLLVVPPDKGYGANGNPSGGISGTNTLVFVVDILDAT